MDKGEVLKYDMKIVPGQNGSFVLYSEGAYGAGSLGLVFGFTTVSDLLNFLTDEAMALADEPKTKSTRSVGAS